MPKLVHLTQIRRAIPLMVVKLQRGWLGLGPRAQFLRIQSVLRLGYPCFSKLNVLWEYTSALYQIKRLSRISLDATIARHLMVNLTNR